MTTCTRLHGRRMEGFGQITRRMDWWLPEARGARSQANRPDSVGAALGDLILSNRISSHAPRPAIAYSSVISAANGKHCTDSRLAAKDLRSDRMGTVAVAYRGAVKGKKHLDARAPRQRAKLGRSQASFSTRTAKIDLHGSPLETRSECNTYKGPLYTACDWLVLQRHIILRACLRCSTIPTLPAQHISHTPRATRSHA